MKKGVLISCIFLSCLFMAHGGTLEDNCGCGLGTMVFEGQDGVLSQTFAVTTNGFFMNNLFGISSGTVGCEEPPGLVSVDRLNIFVAGNMDNLAKDIAVGNGEVLSTLADLMQIPQGKRVNFNNNLRNNFSNIYSADDVTSAKVVNNILKITNS